MNVALVEDHAPTRAEMKALVEREPDLVVVGQSATAEDALEMCRLTRPDIVVMDILLPGMNGVDATRLILAQHPAVRVVALSNHAGRALVQAILDAGGLGYVRKDRAFEELVPAIRSIAAGRQYVGGHLPTPRPPPAPAQPGRS